MVHLEPTRTSSFSTSFSALGPIMQSALFALGGAPEAGEEREGEGWLALDLTSLGTL